jgi:hypothetical protein
MPLLSGKKNIRHNISVERRAGKPEDQAVAIAMSKAGVSKRAKDYKASECVVGEKVSVWVPNRKPIGPCYVLEVRDHEIVVRTPYGTTLRVPETMIGKTPGNDALPAPVDEDVRCPDCSTLAQKMPGGRYYCPSCEEYLPAYAYKKPSRDALPLPVAEDKTTEEAQLPRPVPMRQITSVALRPEEVAQVYRSHTPEELSKSFGKDDASEHITKVQGATSLEARDKAKALAKKLECEGKVIIWVVPVGTYVWEVAYKDSSKAFGKDDQEPGVHDPAAVAAAIGRKKLGGAEMARRAAAGRGKDVITAENDPHSLKAMQARLPALKKKCEQLYEALGDNPSKAVLTTWHNATNTLKVLEAAIREEKRYPTIYDALPLPVEDDFKSVERSVAKEPGIHNPAAVAAAAIGRKKYGTAGMARKVTAGRAKDASPATDCIYSAPY